MTETREHRVPQPYVEAWERAGLGPTVLNAGGGALVVVRRGGRVVPFDASGRPLLWLSPHVRPRSDMAAWALSGAWNFGAERLWIGPEWRLMVKDRADFLGTYALSPAMDPGAWDLESVGEAVVLRAEMSLPAHQPEAGLDLRVTQTIEVVSDPARRLPESTGLSHLGWSREVLLQRGPGDDGSAACQSWMLSQVEAPATVLVPRSGPDAVTDYFEPVDDRHLRPVDHGLAIALSGRSRFKVGLRTGEHAGVVAAWRDGPDGTAVLLVRYFHDTPSSRYLEEPPERVGHEGDSLYVYNDDGRFGDFGEVEALGRALEPEMGSVRDRFEMHAWWGKPPAVARLARRLLDVEPVAAGRHGLDGPD